MIVLDTHIFLWLTLQPERVPRNIMLALKEEDHIVISAISLWETAMLHARNRITIPGSLLTWLYMATTDIPRLAIHPLTPEIAVLSGSLPIHGDPADRLIAATAMEHNCQLATVDKRLLNFKSLKTVQL